MARPPRFPSPSTIPPLRRAGPAGGDAPSPDRARIARINEVSAMARASWIAMLGYFAFVFVTLLGVEDADFFVPSRQTQLPLVNVSIPTASFFWFAPALGAALYVYLHIVLLKLWDAIADLEKPRVDGHLVGDLINPWLANDWALSQRGGDFTPARPLRVLGNVATLALVWAAGLFVLVFAWWRSMPAHNEGLTLWLGLCLVVAGVAGLDSWRAARAWLIPPRREPTHRPPWRRPGLLAAGAAVAAASWAGAEGGIDRYVGATVDLANRWGRPDGDAERPTGFLRRCYPEDFGSDAPIETPLPDCFDALGAELPRDMVQERRIAAVWPVLEDLTFSFPALRQWNLFASTELRGVRMAARPDGWRDRDAARQSYRDLWCSREGIAMEVCGRAATAAEPVPIHVTHERRSWCAARTIPVEACDRQFEDLDRRFSEDWRDERAAQLAGLPGIDLARQDLRRAAAGGVALEGADLREARLEGANLAGALLQGTDLWRARLELADLWRARLEGAFLGEARLSGADLREADFQDANWDGASNRASPAHHADFRTSKTLAQSQLRYLIGNAQTLLPDRLNETGERYYVWSCWEAPPEDFDAMIATAAGHDALESEREALRRQFLCGPGNPRVKTGTPWPVDAPRPEGHPLGP